ncbi:MAG: DUF2079 domain-containing protein [Eubacteriales bacterium]|nr:DUF2079 domain-containing protein [Eubacteriales bacterium]
MIKSLHGDIQDARFSKGDWPLLGILAFVGLQLLTLLFWGSPRIFSGQEALAPIPATALAWQILIFSCFGGLAFFLRLQTSAAKLWQISSILIATYLLTLSLMRQDLTFSLASLVCLVCLAWTNYRPCSGKEPSLHQQTLLAKPSIESLLPPSKGEKLLAWGLLTAALCGYLFFMGRLSLHRVWGMSTTTYDFGLFNQMFAYLKETGLPLTTLERDGLSSHFQVHFSPIFYLILPLYALIPRPETLQLAQLAIICSGILPLYLLARHFKLPLLLKAAIGACYLLQPGLVLGSVADLHENCFLAPLICWLFWALFAGRAWASLTFALLLLLVKEDAALYLLTASLFIYFSPLLAEQKYYFRPPVLAFQAKLAKFGHRQGTQLSSDQKLDSKPGFSLSSAQLGLTLAFLALAAFLLISMFLEKTGEGLMSYRFESLQQYGGSGLAGIARSIFQNPAHTLALMFAPEKFNYLLSLTLATGFLPFLQPALSHYLLFLPLLVMNLATNYPYQYEIYYQYNYGSHTFLLIALLLAVVGLYRYETVQLADQPKVRNSWQLRRQSPLLLLLVVAVISSAVLSFNHIKEQDYFISKYQSDPTYYQAVRQDLEQLPRDKVIAADSFSTTFLADCPELYDLIFHTSVTSGSRNLDLLVWVEASTSYDPELTEAIEDLWALYKERGYRERPDLSRSGAVRILTRPGL